MTERESNHPPSQSTLFSANVLFWSIFLGDYAYSTTHILLTKGIPKPRHSQASIPIWPGAPRNLQTSSDDHPADFFHDRTFKGENTKACRLFIWTDSPAMLQRIRFGCVHHRVDKQYIQHGEASFCDVACLWHFPILHHLKHKIASSPVYIQLISQLMGLITWSLWASIAQLVRA